MTRDQIVQRVRSIIADHLDEEPRHVTETVDFADLGADSLDIVEITIAVEDAFEVELPDPQTDPLTSLGALVDHVLMHLKVEVQHG